MTVRPGTNWEFLDRAHEVAVPAYEHFDWQLVGAFVTAMRNDDEALLLWVTSHDGTNQPPLAAAELRHAADDPTCSDATDDRLGMLDDAFAALASAI